MTELNDYDLGGKLVRDEIPRLTEEIGGELVYDQVTSVGKAQGLIEKLHEEASEIDPADIDPSELADIMEIVLELGRIAGITPDLIEKIREEKADIKGGFRAGIVAHVAKVPEDSDMDRYYGLQPERYPKIK